MGSVTGSVPLAVRKLTPEHRDRLARTLLELRIEHRMTYPMIATVFQLYEGVQLSENQALSWARALGVPANPAKTENCLRTLHRKETAA